MDEIIQGLKDLGHAAFEGIFTPEGKAIIISTITAIFIIIVLVIVGQWIYNKIKYKIKKKKKLKID